MKNRYDVKIIETMEEWAEMSESWNDLLMQSKSNTIFLTWEWLYTWAEYYLEKNRKLFIIAIYERSALIGIAPFYINPVCFGPFHIRQIEFLGSPETASDYLDVFAIRGKEKEIAQYLYNYLFHIKSSKWDMIFLRDIPSESLFLLYFLKNIKKNRGYFEIQEGSFCPVLRLPETHKQFISTLSPNRKKRLNYDMNVLKRAGEYKCYTIQSIDSKSHLNKFLSIYKKRWQNNNAIFYSFLGKFTSRGNKKSWVTIDFLNINGKDIAGLFLLRYQGILSMYLMAADINYNKKISIGNILTALSIEKAINDGISIFDFLKGEEEYKFYWAKEGKRCLNLFSCQRNLGTIFYALKKFLKSIAKIVLSRSGKRLFLKSMP